MVLCIYIGSASLPGCADTDTPRHLAYDKAGHSFGLPNQLRTNDVTGTFKMGGTAAGNDDAATNSWKAMLEFLETELRRRGGNSIDK